MTDSSFSLEHFFLQYWMYRICASGVLNTCTVHQVIWLSLSQYAVLGIHRHVHIHVLKEYSCPIQLS